MAEAANVHLKGTADAKPALRTLRRQKMRSQLLVAGVITLAVVTALAILGTLGCWFAAIWVHNDDLQTRLMNTGFLGMFVDIGLGAVTAFSWMAVSDA